MNAWPERSRRGAGDRSARVAVVGGGLGGLSAAGYLACAGHSVVLFEQAPTVGGKAGRFTRGGITLDWGPTMLTWPSVVRDTFRALGAMDLMPRLFELTHHCRYIGDDGARFDVEADLSTTVASAERVMPGEGQALRAFFSEAERIWRTAGEPYLCEEPYQGAADFLWRMVSRDASGAWALSRRRSLAKLATSYFRAEILRSFVDRFATYVGASPFEASAVFAMLPHLEHESGVYHVEGGLGALAPALARALARLGVVVHTSARVTERPVAGGSLEVDGERFDAVVKNTDPLAEASHRSAELALSGYVLLLQVDRRLELPHHSIFFARDVRAELRALSRGEWPSDQTLAVCHPVATDGSMAPLGRSGLYVMVNAPPLRQGWDERSWPAELNAVRERVLERLRAKVPELEGASVTVLGERTPLELQAMGAPRGSLYGFVPRGLWGPFRRPSQVSRQPGVFFVGGGTFPGGGVPLVLRSGAWASRLVDAYVGRGAS